MAREHGEKTREIVGGGSQNPDLGKFLPGVILSYPSCRFGKQLFKREFFIYAAFFAEKGIIIV